MKKNEKKIKNGHRCINCDHKQKIRRRFYNKLLYLVLKQINVITPDTHTLTEKTVVPIRKLF